MTSSTITTTNNTTVPTITITKDTDDNTVTVINDNDDNIIMTSSSTTSTTTSGINKRDNVIKNTTTSTTTNKDYSIPGKTLITTTTNNVTICFKKRTIDMLVGEDLDKCEARVMEAIKKRRVENEKEKATLVKCLSCLSDIVNEWVMTPCRHVSCKECYSKTFVTVPESQPSCTSTKCIAYEGKIVAGNKIVQFFQGPCTVDVLYEKGGKMMKEQHVK